MRELRVAAWLKNMIGHYNIQPASNTVLIVDDDPAVRASLQFCLELEGFQVRTYACGSDLLDDRSMPATGCLVIDYRLPDMSGLDLLAELRRRNVAFPEIVITTHPSPAVRSRTAAADAVLIEKPLLNEALFEGIRAIMRMQPSTALPPAKPH
jgi:FixJ family two-component response regulator